METLYQKTVAIKRLKEYFTPPLALLTKPSGNKMLLLLLAMISMQFVTSINHLFKWSLSDISGTSLNAYYYLITYTEIPLDAFFAITVKLALPLVTRQMRGLPILLTIDGTLQAKHGTKFACCQTMFDHAKHGGNRYLKGHCFVALTISIPTAVGSKVHYLNIPVGFRLRDDGGSKLMIDAAMDVLSERPMVMLLCDSWYPKGETLKTVNKHPNLEPIANARADSALFGLPPGRTGKPGRPAEIGRKLNIHTDLNFIGVGEYFIAAKTALTNLFGKLPVYLAITTPDIFNHKAYRVFICTVLPDRLFQQFKGYEKKLSDSLASQMAWTFPLHLYPFRWAVEVESATLNWTKKGWTTKMMGTENRRSTQCRKGNQHIQPSSSIKLWNYERAGKTRMK